MPNLKDELLKLATSLSLPKEEFADAGIHAWPAIMHKIEAAFFKKYNGNTHFNWSWDNLKTPQHSILFFNGRAYESLPLLVDASEKVWFIACDDKFWLFEGTIHAIKLLISEHYAFEYYVVAKKYTWLLCETDHNVLIGVGGMIAKMQNSQLPVK